MQAAGQVAPNRPVPFCMQARGAAVILFEVFLNGLLLGGMYGLVALGLNLQYGVARILNLSYGEFFLGGAFAAFFSIMLWKLNPLLSLFISLPVAFAINWLMYQYLDHAPDPPGAGPGWARCRRGACHLRPAFRVPGPGSGQLERRGARLQLPVGAGQLRRRNGGAEPACGLPRRLLAGASAVRRAAAYARRRCAQGHHHRPFGGEYRRRRC